MKKRLISTMTILAFVVLSVSVITAQDKMETNKKENAEKKSCCSSSNEKSRTSMQMHESHDMQSMDIKALDKNKDGKIYQCPMCADQLADEAGKCSKCEMSLNEVSVEKAQKSHDKMHYKQTDGHKMDHSKMMKHDMKHDDHDKIDNKMDKIVREGKIDLIAIDKNKDGKVFQDPMDWNVISDEAGECPICGMKLKEVTIDTAKRNLLKNGFKIK